MFQRKKSTKELHNNDETEKDAEVTTHKKDISPEERQQIINELRLLPKRIHDFRLTLKKKNKLSIN